MRSLCPMTTPGSVENVYPSTSNPHVQCRPICIQMPGADGDRCGSLARIGLPVVVRSPPMTHELDPIPLPPPTPSSLVRVASTAATSGAACLIAALAAGAAALNV